MHSPGKTCPLPLSVDDVRRLFDQCLLAVRELNKAGVTILAGTDASTAFQVPGFSLHDELSLLVTAGLSEMDALETATRNRRGPLTSRTRARSNRGCAQTWCSSMRTRWRTLRTVEESGLLSRTDVCWSGTSWTRCLRKSTRPRGIGKGRQRGEPKRGVTVRHSGALSSESLTNSPSICISMILRREAASSHWPDRTRRWDKRQATLALAFRTRP